MTRDELVKSLGEPDDKGGVSRKYPTPSVYKYGEIEFWFEPYKDGRLLAIRLEDQAGYLKPVEKRGRK